MRYFFLFFITTAFACTDFVVEAQDGTLVNGRSLEFARELKANIQIFARNQKKSTTAPNQKESLSWTTKYGYLGVNAMGMNFSFDGMNEVGLSFGYLWLPNFTKYPSVAIENMGGALDFIDFCDWVLGNFGSIAEVKEALKSVYIWGHPVPSLGEAPVHAAIHDAKGNHLVVEFVNGQMQVYDNPIGVLTNSPPFPWQMINLQNFLNVNPYNPSTVTFKGVKMQPPGQGGGGLGLPGDWTPPSRFVKTFTLLRFAGQPAKGCDAVNLVEHLLNTVDIPLGEIRESAHSETGDYTQWVVIKDMTQKVFYFRSYGDLALKKIDMKRVSFAKDQKNSLPIDLMKGYFDVTDSLNNKKESVTVRADLPRAALE